MTTDAAVEALARLHGVVTSFHDARRRLRTADTDVLVALLCALGVPIDRADDAPSVLEETRHARARRRLEPVLVHRPGQPDSANASIPAAIDPGELWLALDLEDGTVRRARLEDALRGPLAAGPESAQPGAVVAPLDLSRLAGDDVPPGWHRLTLEGAGAPDEARILSAPRCPTPSRRMGAFMPLHAVRTEQDWGIGTYTHLEQLGSWLSRLGIDLLATLPLYPAFLEPPADPSPYMPVSRLAYNEAFIDPLALPEFGACPDAQRIWSGPLAARVRALRDTDLVPYEEVAVLLRRVLEPMSRFVCGGHMPARRAELERFAGRHPELRSYAAYRADRERSTTGAGAGTGHDGATAFHLYCQWAAHAQMTAAAQRLSLLADFPVGSHPDGFDPVWSPTSFVARVHGGAPPDAFFPGGQDWGFRPLHPERIREDGYAFLTAALDRAFRHAACVRIDHVMGLQRLYMIPDGTEGRGAYVEYHAEEMHALVALEAHRHGCAVVGEDLGTVPPEVRPRLAREGILRTWVFQFESTESCPLPAPPDDCLAALGTHDLPRFAAFLWGEDIGTREEQGLLTVEESRQENETRARWRAHLLERLGIEPLEPLEPLESLEPGRGLELEPNATTASALEGCLGALARSAAPIALVDLEDVWGERAPQNVPGTGPEAQNWRRRSSRTLEEMEADGDLATLLASLATERAS